MNFPLQSSAQYATTIQQLEQEFSLFVFPFGTSHFGQNLLAISMGNREKPPALFVATHHSLEWITTLILLQFIKDMSIHQRQKTPLLGFSVSSLLEKHHMVLVPLLNPDGLDLVMQAIPLSHQSFPLLSAMLPKNTSFPQVWQANGAGVDLNHNYDANFYEGRERAKKAGYEKPGPTRFCGFAPCSEPETKSLVSLIHSLCPCHLLALHAQGEEIYYDFNEAVPAGGKKMAKTLSALSGYRLATPHPLASSGGLKDWFISSFSRPGFTIEVGLGKNPLPLSFFPAIYKKVLPMLLYLLQAS